MNETTTETPDEPIAMIRNNEFVVGNYLIKAFKLKYPPESPTPRELLINFLEAAGIEYRWEEHSCGDGNISQVWFSSKEGWELVFEFDAETGQYSDIFVEG